MQDMVMMLSIGGLGILVIILGILVLKLHARITKLTRGAQGSNLESIIGNHGEIMKHIQHTQTEQHDSLQHIHQQLQDSIRGVGLVRFNPFKDTGGSQSFAIALLSNKNSGVIISSLYTRDRVNVFAKTITNGTSSITLTDEESQALNQAQSQLH